MQSSRDSFDLEKMENFCCHFKENYLHCLMTNLNFLCNPAELLPLHREVKGISEICHDYFDFCDDCP